MGALTFEKCCGCIELKTGCFIVGYLNLIAIIAFIVDSIMTLLAVIAIANQDPEQKDATQAAGLLFIILGGIMLLYLILALAFCIVLLVGLHKNRPGHLKAYLIYTVFFLVMRVIIFLIQAFHGLSAGGIARDLISILLDIYFLLVIRSQYFVMKDPRGRPAIYSAA